jgi:DNA-binding response OmpR family regulator
MRNKGRTLERSMILGRLFDDGSSFVDDNTLSVYINRLREKIGDTKREKPYIQTVRGVGYRFIDG